MSTSTRRGEHPEAAAIDVPAKDGTLLHVTLHREADTGRFTYSSLLEVQGHTAHGLRPLVSYYAGSIHHVDRARGLCLHDGTPDLLIEGHWLIHLSDWIEMLTEASVDTWGVDS